MTERNDERLVREFLSRVEDLSNGHAGELIGVSESTVRRWRKGEISTPLHTSTRLGLKRYLTSSNDEGLAGSGGTSQEQARALVVDPNLARRLLGKIEMHHKKTRLAMIQEFEISYVEAGLPIPEWLDELRREVLEGA